MCPSGAVLPTEESALASDFISMQGRQSHQLPAEPAATSGIPLGIVWEVKAEAGGSSQSQGNDSAESSRR